MSCLALAPIALRLPANSLSFMRYPHDSSHGDCWRRRRRSGVGPRVLPALPERIGGPVHKPLEKLGVTGLTNAVVSEVTADGLHITAGQFIPATLKVWAAGIRAPGFLHELDGLESNRINQLQVRPTLQTSRDDNIFAFGDCAACPQKGTERNVPPRAAPMRRISRHRCWRSR